MTGLFILLAVVESFPRIWNIPVEVTEDNKDDILSAIYRMFAVVKTSIVLICAISNFMCIYQGFPVWPMYLLIVIMLFTIVFTIFRVLKLQ